MYGANHDKHLPPHAFAESAEQLAARWIREWEHGIDDTGIKPAFIKIGVDAGPLSTIDAKLVRAAALAHKATGLPLAAHTGSGVAAFEELDLVEEAGVPLSAFIWVHAQTERLEKLRACGTCSSTIRALTGAPRGSMNRRSTSTCRSCCDSWAGDQARSKRRDPPKEDPMLVDLANVRRRPTTHVPDVGNDPRTRLQVGAQPLP